jgi:hypothetical protein
MVSMKSACKLEPFRFVSENKFCARISSREGTQLFQAYIAASGSRFIPATWRIGATRTLKEDLRRDVEAFYSKPGCALWITLVFRSGPRDNALGSENVQHVGGLHVLRIHEVTYPSSGSRCRLYLVTLFIFLDENREEIGEFLLVRREIAAIRDSPLSI